MENASKALLIAGAILLCILIIAIGMFIYNSAQSTINDSMTSMSTQEIDAFNAQFTSYEGKQTGSQIKALMGRLIGNADTYRDESASVPQVYIDQLSNTRTGSCEATFVENDEGTPDNYINMLGSIRNSVEAKHTYWVELTFQTNGLINYIVISYDADNPATDATSHTRN
jgi:hypothetical protein